MSEYPDISKGLGKFTPAMWTRVMDMLRWYEDGENDRGDVTLQSLHRRVSVLENQRPWFFAKLLRARVLDLELYNPNVFAYSWVEVRPKTGDPECCALCLDTRTHVLDCCTSSSYCGDGGAEIPGLQLQGYYQWEEFPNNSSWGDTLDADDNGDRSFSSDGTAKDPLAIPCVYENLCISPNTEPYTYPANNLLELFNDGINAGGVDQSDGIGDFMMQAIGGGDTQLNKSITGVCDGSGEPPCTQYEFPLKTTPVVIMFGTQETDGTFRYVFQAANSYDGTCVDCE